MIRQVIVVRLEDFSSAIEDGSKERTKSSEEDEQLLWQVEARLRELLGDYKGPLSPLGVPYVDWQVQLAQIPPRDLSPLEQVVISVGIPDLPGGIPNLEGLRQ